MRAPLWIASAALATSLAAWLLVPAATGFTTTGSILGLTQRDFRIFNNFTAATANDNVTPDAQFPGYDGAEMAIWKASIEWGSELHGNGNGDPSQAGGLGSGGANFDPSFQGNATGVGGTNDNIHSQLNTNGNGVLAFCETPTTDGWRIRYHQDPQWNDGPTTAIGFNGMDLQGVACHEYGHAIGLGHTNVAGSTMTPAVSGNATADRSIGTDDINGVRAVYGVKLASKPRITGVAVNGNQITISGQNFSGSNNEVWFTQAAAGGNGNPIKLTGINSSAGQITVTVPGTAGKGDVLVRNSGTGNANLSNAWPLDVTGGGGNQPPAILALVPNIVGAVAPDGQVLQIQGFNLSNVNALSVDGIALAPGDFQVVNDTLITASLPLMTQLGFVPVSLTSPAGNGIAQLFVLANDPPVVDLKDSDPFQLLNAFGATVRIGSVPGEVVVLASSFSDQPSLLPGIVNLGIGNGFLDLIQQNTKLIPASGWVQVSFPLGVPPGTRIYVQAISFDLVSLPVTSSNVQTSVVAF
jgi:hypothetical protein